MPKQASGHESDAKDVGAKALSAHYICITSFSHGLNINEAFRGVGTICNVLNHNKIFTKILFSFSPFNRHLF